MTDDASGALRDGQIPPDVIIKDEARQPVSDPTLGIDVTVDRTTGAPHNRLVTIGDSLTHGFQSGAIFRTDLSYPAIIARELGLRDAFRYPTYSGYGGLPLNIEFIVRSLERDFGNKISWWELAPAAFQVRHLMAQIEDWWERGPGAEPPRLQGINHNLGIYGWDLRDTLSGTADVCQAEIDKPTDALFRQIVENANERAALRVLDSARLPDGTALSPLGAAEQLGAEGVTAENGSPSGEGDGIETLIVMLGANNALQTVTQLKVVWSDDGFDNLEQKRGFTVWRPEHFEQELQHVVAQVEKIRARHVIWGTVPHVTIAPIARGVARKVRPGSRYFPYYTRPWIADEDFDVKRDPCITEHEARAIDCAIDQYNDAIVSAVKAARNAGRDWYVLDLAGLLDRLALRRYLEDPAARPDWWQPYELPPELAALEPPPDSRFFTSDGKKRMGGGLFALDGVHPTTVAYGIVAQEFINVMQRAGVRFFHSDSDTPRESPVRVDFRNLIGLDTLISDPPQSLGSDVRLVGWLDEHFSMIRRLLRVGSHV
jgi:hypothetical protein